jgi:hypothetical protein
VSERVQNEAIGQLNDRSPRRCVAPAGNNPTILQPRFRCASASVRRSLMILPPASLGMLGGVAGPLAVLAAHEMGYRVVVLDPDRTVAGHVANRHLVAAFDDPDALDAMAANAQRCAEFRTFLRTRWRTSPVRPMRPSAECMYRQNRISESLPQRRLSGQALRCDPASTTSSR